jgi:uncharacterized membrane protein YuzA (DUF378 family)
MERRLNAIDWIALTLLVIGGLNWLLVGLFRVDVVAALFGGQRAVVSRIVYVLVGISAVYVAIDAFTLEHKPAGMTAGSGA